MEKDYLISLLLITQKLEDSLTKLNAQYDELIARLEKLNESDRIRARREVR